MWAAESCSVSVGFCSVPEQVTREGSASITPRPARNDSSSKLHFCLQNIAGARGQERLETEEEKWVSPAEIALKTTPEILMQRQVSY